MDATVAMPIIETRGLKRHFFLGSGFFGRDGVIRAVDGVDLSVMPGETFAIVGESGCGKSTLARLLVRLIEPTEGEVFYKGKELTAASATELRDLRAEMQFVFQDPFSSLNPRMTVGTLVGEPLLVHRKMSSKQRRARVAELLERVGLRAEHARRYPHEFSGGQRQRIGIARALASEPKILIGDEPVSALDVSVQAQIINLVEDLKDDFGLTLIIIAHDLAVIRHMSDRTAVMYLGEVVELSDTDRLYEQPLHPYTQALMRAIPVPSPGRQRDGSALTGDIPSPASPPSGCRFHTRCPHAADICRTERPVPETAEAGRMVACHRWREIPAMTFAGDDIGIRREAAERRFELYRRYSEEDSERQPAQAE